MSRMTKKKSLFELCLLLLIFSSVKCELTYLAVENTKSNSTEIPETLGYTNKSNF